MKLFSYVNLARAIRPLSVAGRLTKKEKKREKVKVLKTKKEPRWESVVRRYICMFD